MIVDLEGEVWKKICIKGQEADFEISNFGRVKSFKRKRDGELRILVLNSYGDYQITFTMFNTEGTKKILITRTIKNLLCIMFKGMPEDVKTKISFKDGNKKNIKLENLMWKKIN